jgi:sigma-E factor negative regulatory protein RseA
MSEEISALLDGALPEREGFEQIDFLNGDRERQRTWETYGLIGDVLRGHIHAGCASRVSSRIAVEPIVISPRYRSSRHWSPGSAGQKWFAMSAAAVIAAVVFVAWVSLPRMTTPNQDQIARVPSDAVAPVGVMSDFQPVAASAASQWVGGYIMAHQQFSPSNSLQGVSTYVRLVSEDVTGVSR